MEATAAGVTDVVEATDVVDVEAVKATDVESTDAVVLRAAVQTCPFFS